MKLSCAIISGLIWWVLIDVSLLSIIHLLQRGTQLGIGRNQIRLELVNLGFSVACMSSILLGFGLCMLPGSLAVRQRFFEALRVLQVAADELVTVHFPLNISLICQSQCVCLLLLEDLGCGGGRNQLLPHPVGLALMELNLGPLHQHRIVILLTRFPSTLQVTPQP